MNELKLYELADDYREALEALTDVEDEAVQDTLEGLKGALEVKSINVAKYIGNLNATADAIDNAIKQMTARKNAYQNKAKRIKNWLKLNMEACKITEIIAPEFALKIVNNPPAVILSEEEDLIPDKFKKKVVTISIDKIAIKNAINSGEEVQGARLESSTRLQIK